jgi:hypothetical protein
MVDSYEHGVQQVAGANGYLGAMALARGDGNRPAASPRR